MDHGGSIINVSSVIPITTAGLPQATEMTASPARKRAGYITGATIVVDGGVTIT